eukprot:11197338-Prorocentrum_lima.AAC.1
MTEEQPNNPELFTSKEEMDVNMQNLAGVACPDFYAASLCTKVPENRSSHMETPGKPANHTSSRRRRTGAN